MKKMCLLVLCQSLTFILLGQKISSFPSNTKKIEMLFPEGKTKAVIFSYDDGMIADRKLVKLMNIYGIKGTFHLNSNKLDTKGYLTKAEINNLFKGHEVSVHSANHPGLGDLSKQEIMNEVLEDRRELERLTHKTVRGMAYPFGNYNDKVIDAITGLGIEYARTVNDSYHFSIPKHFLIWEPSIHQFAKAYYIANDTLNDKKELAIFNKLVTDFLQSDTLALLDIWGHSWENEGAGNRWKKTEDLFKLLSKRKEVHFATQIDLVDYINAFNILKFSVNKNIVFNPSALNVYIRVNNKSIKVPAGGKVFI